MTSTDCIRETVSAVYLAESRRVLATLIRLLGVFDAAEEALHEAFRASARAVAARGRARESAGMAPVGKEKWHRSPTASAACEGALAKSGVLLAAEPRPVRELNVAWNVTCTIERNLRYERGSRSRRHAQGRLRADR